MTSAVVVVKTIGLDRDRCSSVATSLLLALDALDAGRGGHARALLVATFAGLDG